MKFKVFSRIFLASILFSAISIPVNADGELNIDMKDQPIQTEMTSENTSEKIDMSTTSESQPIQTEMTSENTSEKIDMSTTSESKNIESSKEKISNNKQDQDNSLKEISNVEVKEFSFLGIGDWTFSTISYSNDGKLIIKYNNGQPHYGYGDKLYASIKITGPDNQIKYSKEMKGNEYLSDSKKEFNLNEGDILSIYHDEPSRLRVADNEMKSQDSDIKTFNYEITTDKTLKNVTDFYYLRDKVNTLFKNNNHDELSTEANFSSVNTLQGKVEDEKYNITQNEREELKSLLQKAIELLKASGEIVSPNETVSKEVFFLPEPKYLLKEGRKMAAYHDRQDLGIALEGNTKIKIRQSNDSYKSQVKLRLLGNDSKLEKEKNIGSEWQTIDVENSLVPFIETPFGDENATNKPRIELVILEGTAKRLPIYDESSNKNDFINTWISNRTSFSLIKGKKFQMLVPSIDQNVIKSINIQELIHEYDNQLFVLFDTLTGTKKNSENPIHEEEKQRYFIKADAHGAGAAYYGNNWTAQNSLSMDSYLKMNWLPLHEIGHGYEVPSKEMYIIDVLNNVYGTIYQDKYLDNFIKDSWVFNGNKTGRINDVANNLLIKNSGYDGQSYQGKLLLLLSIIDKMTQEGFVKFNQYHREVANNGGDASDLVQLFIEFCQKNYNYNLVPYFNTLNLTVDDRTANQFVKNGSKPLAMLAQVVPDEQIERAINELGFNTNLKSKLSLVSNSDINTLGISSNIHLSFTNFEIIQGSKLRFKDGDKVVKEVNVDNSEIDISDMPNGIYSVELDNGHIIFDKQYVYVKNNDNIELTAIDNYIIKRVKELFSNRDYTNLSDNIDQDKIYNAKKLVNEISDDKQREDNLKLVSLAQQKLKQWNMVGLGDGKFGEIRYFEDGTGKMFFTTEKAQPHGSYGNVKYFSLHIIDNLGKDVYYRNINGSEQLSKETFNWNLQPGYRIIVTHVEANRLRVNDSSLKNDTGQLTYVYEIDENKNIKKSNQEWDFMEEDNKILLTRFIGSSKNVVVPTSYNNITIELKEINSKSIPKDIESFKISKENGNKISLKNKTLRSAFDTFSNLKEVDLSNLDTSGVKDYYRMFSNCKKLVNVNVDGFNTEDAINMNRMFNECDSLTTLNLSSFNLDNVLDNQFMFFVYKEKPLLIITNDDKILNYNFNNDHRRIFDYPKLDGNGGTFSNKLTEKKYFDSCAITSSQSTNEAIEKFKESNIPDKDGFKFVGWDTVTHEKNKNNSANIFGLLNTTFVAKWTRENVNTTTDNIKNELSNNFGILYYPKEFSIGNTELKSKGSQSIDVEKEESFNVGILDFKNEKSLWKLTAQLNWIGNPVKGAYLQTRNELGKIYKNVNDGTSKFNPDRDLVECGDTVNGSRNVVINSSENLIMSKNSQYIDNGIYDYNFKDITLEIPETSHIVPNSYKGQVIWNLQMTP
ncbi:TPA: putative mucin/carbohydrate-binding domain-containing protein [Enterococcus faecium]